MEQGARVRRQRQPSNADTSLQVHVWCYWLNESSIFCDATAFDLHPLVRRRSRWRIWCKLPEPDAVCETHAIGWVVLWLDEVPF